MSGLLLFRWAITFFLFIGVLRPATFHDNSRRLGDVKDVSALGWVLIYLVRRQYIQLVEYLKNTLPGPSEPRNWCW